MWGIIVRSNEQVLHLQRTIAKSLMNKFLNFVMELFCYGILMPINKILLTNCKIVEGLKEKFDSTIDSQEQNSTPLVKSEPHPVHYVQSTPEVFPDISMVSTP